MKTGTIEKQAAGITPEDLALINTYARREHGAEELYAFPLTLCDNEVDRDGERFTIPALHKLAELYLGRTGLYDHKPSAAGQTARIYRTEVVADPGRKTGAGEPYTKLTARAYMLRDEATAATIRSIDAGILKEVSVGCAVEKITCSICGADRKEAPCAHRKGVDYDGQRCHHLLENPTDAYEWSFVAVPAQRDAGVTKQYIQDPPDDGREPAVAALMAECAAIMQLMELEE